MKLVASRRSQFVAGLFVTTLIAFFLAGLAMLLVTKGPMRARETAPKG